MIDRHARVRRRAEIAGFLRRRRQSAHHLPQRWRHQDHRRTGDIKGELTISGITQPVVLATTWNFTGEHPLARLQPDLSGQVDVRLLRHHQVLRSDFGLKRGIPLVSDEVRIDVEAVFLRKD